MSAATSKAIKRNWARASKLAELAGITPFQARKYLATRATDEDKALLDNGADKRNKAVRLLVQEAQSHCGGVAPAKIYESCSDTDTVTVTNLGIDLTGHVAVEILLDLKPLVDKYGQDHVAEGLTILRKLIG